MTPNLGVFEYIFVFALLMAPLGTWKLLEIVIWFIRHISWK